MLRLRHIALVLAGLLLAGCSDPPPPLVFDEGIVTLDNRTDREWRNVRIVVNDHFMGGAPTLAPGGRLNAPLGQFQTGHGQKFDRGRQSVTKIEVTAIDAAGEPVTLRWPDAPIR